MSGNLILQNGPVVTSYASGTGLSNEQCAVQFRPRSPAIPPAQLRQGHACRCRYWDTFPNVGPGRLRVAVVDNLLHESEVRRRIVRRLLHLVHPRVDAAAPMIIRSRSRPGGSQTDTARSDSGPSRRSDRIAARVTTAAATRHAMPEGEETAAAGSARSDVAGESGEVAPGAERGKYGRGAMQRARWVQGAGIHVM